MSALSIGSGVVSEIWQAFISSYITSGRQLSAVQNLFLQIICTLKSVVEKSMAQLSNILFYLNSVGQ